MESILLTIKDLLGLEDDYEAFDSELIVHINSAIMRLRTIGIGPEKGFSITGPDETWTDLLGDDLGMLGSVKDYIYKRVRLAWDPPTTSFVLSALKESKDELEWVLCAESDYLDKE